MADTVPQGLHGGLRLEPELWVVQLLWLTG